MTKKLTDQEWRQQKIGQRSVKDWDILWTPLPRAFSEPHPELRKIRGIIRVKHDGVIKYFIRASETNGGIAKSLQRISGPDQTGNSAYGAQKISKNIDAVEVDIIKITNEDSPRASARELKRALNNIYDPQWNWPNKRRMAAVRKGRV